MVFCASNLCSGHTLSDLGENENAAAIGSCTLLGYGHGAALSVDTVDLGNSG